MSRLITVVTAGLALIAALVAPVGLAAPATAAALTPLTIDCAEPGGTQVSGQVGDTVEITVTGPCSFSISTPGIVTWTDGSATDPLSTGSTTLTFTLLADGVTTWTVLNQLDYPVRFIVSDLGLFSCSVAGETSESVSGDVGDTISFFANGSCDLASSTAGVVTWSAGGPADPASVINALVTLTLAEPGSTQFTAQSPGYPGSGGRLTIDVTVTGAPAPDPDASDEPAPVIPAWVQAFGRASADATCPDGWAASWQEWAQPVTGGWVCTRTVPALGG